MDLEEFRRSYMHMESVGNSPGNFFRRAATLAKSIGAIGPAIKKDRQASKYRYALRQEAKKELKENGMSWDVVKKKFSWKKKSTRADIGSNIASRRRCCWNGYVSE